MGSAKRERQKAGRQARLDQARVVVARRERWKLLRNLAIVAVVVVVALFLFSRNADDDDDVTATGSSTTTSTTQPEPFTYGTGACPAADGSSPRTIDFTDAPQLCIDLLRRYSAVFDTTAGPVRVELDSGETPGATNNFVTLSRYHYFDTTEVFRTDTSIGIIQGGSPHTQDNSDPGPGYTIPDEGFGDEVITGGGVGPYTYQAGDLVYARPAGTPDSSSAQFFFCANDLCSNLDAQGIYIEFGHVVEGIEVLEQIIASAPEGDGAPSEPVTVNTVTIEEA